MRKHLTSNTVAHERAAKGCHPGQAFAAPEGLPLPLHEARTLRNRTYRLSWHACPANAILPTISA